MSKLISLYFDLGRAEIKAESITGFSTGSTQGNGYVYVLGVGTPIKQEFERSRKDWLDYINQENTGSAQVFEFKDMADNNIVARLSDVITIRQEGSHSLVVMSDHIRIESRDDYWDLKERFIKALRS